MEVGVTPPQSSDTSFLFAFLYFSRRDRPGPERTLVGLAGAPVGKKKSESGRPWVRSVGEADEAREEASKWA